jgi:hypothetical protein
MITREGDSIRTREEWWYYLGDSCRAQAERVGVEVNVWDHLGRVASDLGRQLWLAGTDSPAYRQR